MIIVTPEAVVRSTPMEDRYTLALDFIAKTYTTEPAATGFGPDTTLLYSNVPEDDYAEWAAGTYNAGDRVLFDHAIYEALTTTTDQPDVGAAAVPATWVFVSVSNRFKMFDTTVGVGTTNPNSIEVKLQPTGIATAVVLFNVQGATANLTVVTTDGDEVYNKTIDIADFSGVVSYYDYFVSPVSVSGLTEVAFLDIPAYSGAIFTLTINAGTGTASCGEMVFGPSNEIATTNFGTSVGIRDYSIKEVDEFGNIRIVQRAYSKRAEYDVTVETAQVGYFNNFLANIRTTPVVYIGDENRPETIVYGYYRDFSVVLSGPSISECSLTVEGLI